MEPFSTIIMQPPENPCRVLLGLQGDSTEGFFLKKLYCLEWDRAGLPAVART